MRAKLIKESAENKSIIDFKKLVEYAKGIAICCNGEYGDVFYNEDENHIFVCLGDSNPFDYDYLKEYILEAVVTDYKNRDNVNITIENECTPNKNSGTWKKIN